ncbi:DUF397 domain-containing protein [Streptomyces sp. NPDC006307]|uniref:DUF397 domain-containing protein n=1 Tax=Streptomyces sp. NPDC006307 TaxID=3156748 RepID=UPI0033BCA33D
MTEQPSTGGPSELTWVKSSYSTADGPECVEVAAATSTVHVRDSKNVSGPKLGFSPAAWANFVTYATGG